MSIFAKPIYDPVSHHAMRNIILKTTGFNWISHGSLGSLWKGEILRNPGIICYFFH